MPAFRRVLGERAGPTAVGVLVPPGQRTLIVVRPRALNWDLVLAQRGDDGKPGAGFQELGRHQAASTAQKLCQSLIHWAEEGLGGVQILSTAEGFRVWADVEAMPLVACERQPGRPYRPAIFASEAEAREAATMLTAALRPPADANRELYTNTQYFNR